MTSLSVGDLIQDNLGRAGIVLSRSRTPSVKWRNAQDDQRMRVTEGIWWRVVPLDGGGILVPEELAHFLRRANVDDIVKVMDGDSTDDGQATLLFLLAELRAK